MSIEVSSGERLSFPIPSNLRAIIEEAATSVGQSIDDFAVSALVQSARQVIEQRNVTELTARDRDVFLSLLDDLDAEPNESLKAAAARYKSHFGRVD